MRSRRDFLKYAGGVGALMMTPTLAYGESLLSLKQQKAVSQIWQDEKLKADLAKAFAAKFNVELFTTMGTFSATNRKAVVNELIKLYDIDISYIEDERLLYTREQIVAMDAGTFASTKLQDRYDTRVQEGSASQKEALLVMVKQSVDSIAVMQNYLQLFTPSDKITQNILYLIDGAMGHYWALDRELIKMGVVAGCCEAGESYCKTPNEYSVTYGRDHLSDPQSLTQEQRHSIAHMWSEEKMAHDAYEAVYTLYPHLRLFYNIGHWSEVQHMTAVEELVALYNIDINDYTNESKHYDPSVLRKMGPGDYAIEDFETRYSNTLIPYAAKGDIQALQLGCMVEVQDVRDLNQFLADNNGNPYIERTFNYLISGSQSHYWAYHYALIERGISNGCCSAGSDYCKDATEFPSGANKEEFAMLWNRRRMNFESFGHKYAYV
jgi:hypothetical protein